MSTAACCVFHVNINDGGEIRIDLSEEEFHRIQSPSILKHHIEEALKYLNAGGEPKYEPVISRVVARALVENNLVDRDIAHSLIKHQSADRYLQDALNLIGGSNDSVEQSEFRQSIADISDVIDDPETKSIIAKELSKYLEVLQGKTPSLDSDLKERVNRETKGREKRLRVAIREFAEKP